MNNINTDLYLHIVSYKWTICCYYNIVPNQVLNFFSSVIIIAIVPQQLCYVDFYVYKDIKFNSNNC